MSEEISIINHDRIRTLREAQGWTQIQAAEAAGIKNRQDWNSIEKGQRPNLTVSTLAKIAKALQCDPCDLLTTPARKPPKAGPVKVKKSPTRKPTKETRNGK